MNAAANNRPTPQVGYNDKVIIYQSELDYLSRCINESPRIETGGNLFGLWTPFGVPFIHYVVGPGPKAIHELTHFRQDFAFLDRNADRLVAEHALHHIGSWHSHHSLGLAQPSDGDTESTLSGMRECGLPSFLLLIGNYRQGLSTLNAFRYFADGTRIKLKWVVLKGISPIRTTYDNTHPDLVHLPQAMANMASLETCTLLADKEQATPHPPIFAEGYWLAADENRKEFAKIIKFLKTEFEKVSIFQTDRSCVEVQVEDGTDAFKFIFDSSFPQVAPKLLAPKDKQFKYQSTPEWKAESRSISDAFIHFFQTIEL